jgi:pentatricopeptide repeat protein
MNEQAKALQSITSTNTPLTRLFCNNNSSNGVCRFKKKQKMKCRLLLILCLNWSGPLGRAFTLPPRTTPQRLASPLLQASKQKQENEQEKPLVKTIGGGSSMIFEMARRMLVWDAENDAAANPNAVGGVLPRWHPHAGIADSNPSFRTQSPIMNNQGYAGIIWRNVRKRNKPSLWRYALRTYNRMKTLEQDSQESPLKIERTNVHHEGALLACDKLGLWQEAMDIYRHVEATATTNQTVTATTRRRKAVCVTDNMVLSLVSACVRGSKQMNSMETGIKERRAPLDVATQVLLELEEKHGLPLVARHLNPLAAAYHSLGLHADAANLLQNNLTDRTSGPEEENGDDPFNVHDMRAKDKGSYALLVQGAVSDGDWGDAVEALKDMTEAGLYPNSRHLNRWTEISEGKSRQRSTRSWKKKREEYWLESVR